MQSYRSMCVCFYLLTHSFTFILPSSRKEWGSLQKIQNSISQNENEGLKYPIMTSTAVDKPQICFKGFRKGKLVQLRSSQCPENQMNYLRQLKKKTFLLYWTTILVIRPARSIYWVITHRLVFIGSLWFA